MRLLLTIRKIYGELNGSSESVFLEGEEPARKEAWMMNAASAVKLAPLLKGLRVARNDWASDRRQKSFLDFISNHLGYNPETVERLRIQVQTRVANKGQRGGRSLGFGGN